MAQGAGAAAVASVFTSSAAAGPLPIADRVLVVICSGLAGALAGIVYFYTESLRKVGGWKKSIGNIVTLLAFGAFAFGLIALAVLMGFGN